MTTFVRPGVPIASYGKRALEQAPASREPT